MNIKVNSEEELKELAKQAILLLVNLRYWSKQWEENYGVEMKRQKKRWEQKADTFIESIKGTKTQFRKEIKIQIDEMGTGS